MIKIQKVQTIFGENYKHIKTNIMNYNFKRINNFLCINHKSVIFTFLSLLFLHFDMNAQNNLSKNDLASNSSIKVLEKNLKSYVDPSIVVTGNGPISGFVVTITGNYFSGDILSYAGALPPGISLTPFNASTKSLVFNGSTSVANWQNIMRSVALEKASVTSLSENRDVTFSGGKVYFKSIKRNVVSISFNK